MMTLSLTASYNHLTALVPAAVFVFAMLCVMSLVGPEGGADRRLSLKRTMKAMRGRTIATNITAAGTRLPRAMVVYDRNHSLRTSITPRRAAGPFPREEEGESELRTSDGEAR